MFAIRPDKPHLPYSRNQATSERMNRQSYFYSTIIRVFLVLVFFASSSTLSLAKNQYDIDEEIRRAAERLDKEDRIQREAAKQRYDKEHSEPSGSDSDKWIIRSIFACIILYILISIFVKPAKQSSDGGKPFYIKMD